LATTRERGAFGDDYQQTVTFGVRIPFGSDSRNRAKLGLARAEALETEGQLRLERERLAADLEAARVRVESSRIQLAAAEKRAQLARESRGFFDKSFRLGESDLPTRLRIELEAVEAERQNAAPGLTWPPRSPPCVRPWACSPNKNEEPEHENNKHTGDFGMGRLDRSGGPTGLGW
jgi:hypothetical protein